MLREIYFAFNLLKASDMKPCYTAKSLVLALTGILCHVLFLVHTGGLCSDICAAQFISNSYLATYFIL